jgi:hypothetical protein
MMQLICQGRQIEKADALSPEKRSSLRCLGRRFCGANGAVYRVRLRNCEPYLADPLGCRLPKSHGRFHLPNRLLVLLSSSLAQSLAPVTHRPSINCKTSSSFSASCRLRNGYPAWQMSDRQGPAMFLSPAQTSELASSAGLFLDHLGFCFIPSRQLDFVNKLTSVDLHSRLPIQSTALRSATLIYPHRLKDFTSKASIACYRLN